MGDPVEFWIFPGFYAGCQLILMLKVYICLKQAELFCGRKSYGGLRGPLVYRNTEEPHLSEESLALQTELLGEYSREVSTIPPALLCVSETGHGAQQNFLSGLIWSTCS